VFFLFGLLWSDGRDLTGKTVVQRHERLKEIITPVTNLVIPGKLSLHNEYLNNLHFKKLIIKCCAVSSPGTLSAWQSPEFPRIPVLTEWCILHINDRWYKLFESTKICEGIQTSAFPYRSSLNRCSNHTRAIILLSY